MLSNEETTIKQNIIDEYLIEEQERETLVRKHNMFFLKQNVNKEKNKICGWSNPVLSNGKTLNEEVETYRKIYDLLELEENKNSSVLKEELDMSFKFIAGYYSNYENRWLQAMSNLFEESSLFFDFYYDLLRECLSKFNPEHVKKNKYNKNFRKSDVKCYFNQYFFGALSKRKITEIKKKNNPNLNPSILCEECGEHVTAICDFHLNHQYDEKHIKNQFGLDPNVKEVDGKQIKYYEICPLCCSVDVPLEHVETHFYANKMTVEQYVEKYPKANLVAMLLSLNESVKKDDPNSKTIEEFLTVSFDREEEERDFFEHVDFVFKDDQFTADVLKLKVLDYKNNEIAEELGEEFEFSLEYNVSKEIQNKTQLYDHVLNNNFPFFIKYKKNFSIINRKVENENEIFTVTSCGISRVNCTLNKIKQNKAKLRQLFSNSMLRNV